MPVCNRDGNIRYLVAERITLTNVSQVHFYNLEWENGLVDANTNAGDKSIDISVKAYIPSVSHVLETSQPLLIALVGEKGATLLQGDVLNDLLLKLDTLGGS